MEAKDGIKFTDTWSAYDSGFKAGKLEERKKWAEWIKEHSRRFIVGQDMATCAGNEIKGETSYYPIIGFLDWQSFLEELENEK